MQIKSLTITISQKICGKLLNISQKTKEEIDKQLKKLKALCNDSREIVEDFFL